MHKKYIIIAAWLGALAVALGAFGAHKLKDMLTPPQFNTFETAVRYHFYHVFAIALTGLLIKHYPHKWLGYAAGCFITGIVFFCGSLYLLTFLNASGATGYNWLGAITPLGGIFFILGWMFVALGIKRSDTIGDR